MRRFGPAAVAWAAAAALVALWLPTRGSLELNPAVLGAGLRLSLHLDAIAYAGSLSVLLAGAGLLTLRPGERWTLLLAMAASVLALTSSDLVLTAAATGAGVLFVLEATGGERALWPLWVAVLLAAWAGVSLQVVGGTAGYGAAPAAALNAGIAGLVLLAAVCLVGAVPAPGDGWPAAAWVTMPPIGFALLLRVYTLGDGRLPHPALYPGLALAGVLAWGVAGWRAAGAGSWRGVIAQCLPALGGVGLVAAGAGVQLGAVAVVFAMFATAVAAVLAGAASERRRADALLIAALVAGVPPGLAFVARLLAAQALLESNQATAWILIPAALAWGLGVLAAARALSLPPAGAAVARWIAPALGGASALLGVGAGLLAAGLGQPAAGAASLGQSGPRLTAGLSGLEPASAGWPSLLLGGLLVLGVLAAAFAGRARLPAFSEPLPPLVPRPVRPARTWEWPRLPGPKAAEPALSGRRPLLWIVLIVALALIVARIPQ